MVLVSHKYKFIYIKNRKVAGSSVESFFGKYCINPKKEYHYDDTISEHIDKFGIIGSRGCGSADMWARHKDAKSIRNDLGNEKFNEYLKFCVIRNPYDKMVSKFHFKQRDSENKWLARRRARGIKPKLSFKEFIRKYDCII